jgi:Na+/H+-dicarboxylate symporter
MIAGHPVYALSLVGDVFTSLLVALALPLVASVILSGLTNALILRIGSVTRATMSWYVLMPLVTASAATGVALLFHPGTGPPLDFSVAASPMHDDVLQHIVRRSLLWTIGISAMTAVAIAGLHRRGHPLTRTAVDGIARMNAFVMRILSLMMSFAPIGVFALVTTTIAVQSRGGVGQFASALLAIYIAEIVVCVGLVAALRRAGATHPIAAVSEVFLTALATGNSSATLPVELETAEKYFRVPRAVYSFTLPLGVAMSKVGSAAYFAVACIFAANASGVAVNGLMPLQVIVTAALMSVLTPPGGGSIAILGIVFAKVGVPVKMAALVAAIPLAGRLNTPVNALGRLCTTVYVARRHATANVPTADSPLVEAAS